MTASEQPSTTGREHYRSLYQQELELEAEWLRRGTADKADSVELLLRQNCLNPQRMLELGCGTGAVVQECQRRGLASEYVAVDYSAEAIGYLRDRSHGIQTFVADITAEDFTLGGSFDLVVLSHVLEHLLEPEDLLRALGRLDFSYLVAEVPLENLFFGKLKAKLRSRMPNPAGHVQFFTAATFEALLGDFIILDRRRYVPIPDPGTVRFVSRKDDASLPRQAQRMLTTRYLPKLTGPLWSRLYYSHYAVLCRKTA